MPDENGTAPPFLKAAPLGFWVEHMITLVAAALRSPNREKEMAILRASDWEMVLAPDIPAAWIYWTDRQGRRRCDNYLPAQGDFAQAMRPKLPPAAPRRTVSIPFALIETAADLLVDTIDRQQSGLLPSGPPTPREVPDAKTPAPRHREPASVHNQPPIKATKVSGSSYPQPKTPFSPPQASARGTAGLFPENTETRHGRPHSSDRSAA